VFKLIASGMLLLSCFFAVAAQEPAPQDKPSKIEFEYKLLATNRVTSVEMK